MLSDWCCVVAVLWRRAQLKTAIELEIREAGLQVINHTYSKVIQLYETKNSRHSTMIVGQTLSGKTVSWRILQATLSRLAREGDPNHQVVKVRGAWGVGSTAQGTEKEMGLLLEP